jgi:hypothetical protein
MRPAERIDAYAALRSKQVRPNAGYFWVPGLRLAGVSFVLLRLALG